MECHMQQPISLNEVVNLPPNSPHCNCYIKSSSSFVLCYKTMSFNPSMAPQASFRRSRLPSSLYIAKCLPDTIRGILQPTLSFHFFCWLFLLQFVALTLPPALGEEVLLFFAESLNPAVCMERKWCISIIMITQYTQQTNHSGRQETKKGQEKPLICNVKPLNSSHVAGRKLNSSLIL